MIRSLLNGISNSLMNYFNANKSIEELLLGPLNRKESQNGEVERYGENSENEISCSVVNRYTGRRSSEKGDKAHNLPSPPEKFLLKTYQWFSSLFPDDVGHGLLQPRLPP